MSEIDADLLGMLACPIDRSVLRLDNGDLVSEAGRRYPIVDGIPVLLVDEVEQTIGIARASLNRAHGRPGAIDVRAPEYYLESLGISDEEKTRLLELVAFGKRDVDPAALVLIGATSGFAYKDLIGDAALDRYPIPSPRLPQGMGKLLLDVGCSWGRWSVGAAQIGYRVIGLDPSLGAVMAARRIARQLGLDVHFVVADARYLPFRSGIFDTAYSYSVLQHFSKADANKALASVADVLKSGGSAKIQMANAVGVRSLQHQAARRFRAPVDFEVRYWTVPELRRTFSQLIGPTNIETDCYFGLGWQWSDYFLMTSRRKPILIASEGLRRVSDWVSPLRLVADSVFCNSSKL